MTSCAFSKSHHETNEAVGSLSELINERGRNLIQIIERMPLKMICRFSSSKRSSIGTRGVYSLEHSQCAAYDRHRYRCPVALGDHRLMLRPRDSHDLRLIQTNFEFITTSYVALEPRRVRELDRRCIVRRTLRRIADREQSPTGDRPSRSLRRQ